MMLPSQLLLSPTISLLLLQKVWQSARQLKKRKAMMEHPMLKMKEKQHALKPKRKQKVEVVAAEAEVDNNVVVVLKVAAPVVVNVAALRVEKVAVQAADLVVAEGN